MQPTILTNVTPDNPAYRQEFFGPVALFFIARDEDEAIAIANDSPFGLGGSVYTSDIEHGKKVASRVETGMVFINYPSMSAPISHSAESSVPDMEKSFPISALRSS